MRVSDPLLVPPFAGPCCRSSAMAASSACPAAAACPCRLSCPRPCPVALRSDPSHPSRVRLGRPADTCPAESVAALQTCWWSWRVGCQPGGTTPPVGGSRRHTRERQVSVEAMRHDPIPRPHFFVREEIERCRNCGALLPVATCIHAATRVSTRGQPPSDRPTPMFTWELLVVSIGRPISSTAYSVACRCKEWWHLKRGHPNHRDRNNSHPC